MPLAGITIVFCKNYNCTIVVSYAEYALVLILVRIFSLIAETSIFKNRINLQQVIFISKRIFDLKKISLRNIYFEMSQSYVVCVYKTSSANYEYVPMYVQYI